MNKNVKRWDRYSVSSLMDGVTDPRGRLFMSALGQVNLEGLEVLHRGFDTVRQLYQGEIKPGVFADVQRLYGEGFGECIDLGGHVWLIGSGGQSGYSFRLQNSDLGLIVFFKSRHIEVGQSGSHVKIECSPHWVIDKSADQIQRELRELVSVFLDKPEEVGVAVHLAVDVQGWEPSPDFGDTLVTRARRMISHDSAKVLYMDMGEVAMRYNRGQSYLIGSASSCQLAVYRKDLQAKAVDKTEFWQSVWERAAGQELGESAYDKTKPVWRIELRFHQSVMHDFSRGHAQAEPSNYSERSWNSFNGVAKHATGLWRYGLDSFRQEMTGESVRSRWLSPFWQLLAEDVEFSNRGGVLAYKRVKKAPGQGSAKNLTICVGNYISIGARYRWDASRVISGLKGAGLYDELFYFMQARAWNEGRRFDESEIFQMVSKSLQIRILQGRAA